MASKFISVHTGLTLEGAYSKAQHRNGAGECNWELTMRSRKFTLLTFQKYPLKNNPVNVISYTSLEDVKALLKMGVGHNKRHRDIVRAAIPIIEEMEAAANGKKEDI